MSSYVSEKNPGEFSSYYLKPVYLFMYITSNVLDLQRSAQKKWAQIRSLYYAQREHS